MWTAGVKTRSDTASPRLIYDRGHEDFKSSQINTNGIHKAYKQISFRQKIEYVIAEESVENRMIDVAMEEGRFIPDWMPYTAGHRKCLPLMSSKSLSLCFQSFAIEY